MAKVSKITKRDGRIVDFDQTKIANAILKAFTAVEQGDEDLAKRLSNSRAVAKLVNERFEGRIPSARIDFGSFLI